MYFQLLQRRLIEALRGCIGNGLLTERGLARGAGISQPHMHHILKGARSLSPEMADRILRALRLTVLDLLELAEMEARPGRPPLGRGHERIQMLVIQARVEPDQAGWAPGPGRESGDARMLTAGGPWPLRDRLPGPGARPPPN